MNVFLEKAVTWKTCIVPVNIQDCARVAVVLLLKGVCGYVNGHDGVLYVLNKEIKRAFEKGLKEIGIVVEVF